MNVSRLTVRKAYSALIEAGILTALQGKGTFVNDLAGVSPKDLSLDSRKGFLSKKVIGVIFPEVTTFFAPILKEIEDVASRSNYALNIMFNDNFERESNAISTMLANGVDGILLNPRHGVQAQSNPNYVRLVECGLPVVMVGKPPIYIDMDCVMCDDITGAYSGVSRLIANGHRRILRLYESRDDAEALFERREGYSEAITSLLPGEKEYHLNCGDPDWLRQLVDLISGENPVTAVFSDNDALAAQAYMHLVNQGITRPGCQDFVAYNSLDLCKQFNLDLMTVNIPRAEMGRCAIEMLKDKLENPKGPRPYSVYSVFRPYVQEM
jgi:DNA-binding LacI/PurR family transcriptional regulator